MKLFQFIAALFAKNGWEYITDKDKKTHFFMVQRLLSIKYPFISIKFNHVRIDKFSALDYWHKVLSKKYERVPPYMSTSTQGRRMAKKTKGLKLPDKDIISAFCHHHMLGTKDLAFFLENEPKLIQAELKLYEKSLID